MFRGPGGALAAESATTSAFSQWEEYRPIMWVGDSAFKQPEKFGLFLQRLREMGVTVGMVHGQASAKPFVDQGFPYYLENMVNRGLCLKFNSHVADWDKFVTGWVRDGRPESGLVRDYCLDDPEWNQLAVDQVQKLVREHQPNHPLAYDLRDELSMTLSANPFDYDFSPIALAGFRAWLKSQYASLGALNEEWETRFESWESVLPFTTDQIKNRMASGDAQPKGKPDWGQVAALKFRLATARQEPVRWNFAPWADHRTYCDISLARALSNLRSAIRALDPKVPVGIEGTQMPHAFGGYDLWRISQAVDWVEPYDIGNAREIFGSFMPNRPLLTTVFEQDTNHARRRLWRLLLEGDRGCIIWWSEDCIDWKSSDYTLTAKGRALAPVLKEMSSPLARLFLRAKRVRDPIYLHYSQASIQVDWLLESTVDGSTWLRRFSSFEAEHNRQAAARNAWLKLFQDLGFSPQFLSSEQIESGALAEHGGAPVVLALPSSWALGAKEAAELKQFLTSSNSGSHRVFFDGRAGVFDQHGRIQPRSILEELGAVYGDEPRAGVMIGNRRNPVWRNGQIADFGVERLRPALPGQWCEWAKEQLGPMVAPIKVPPEHRVRIHRFQVAGAELAAFERNINYQMSEDLSQAGGNEALEREVQTEAVLTRKTHLYDLRAGRYLGFSDRLPLFLDPWQPSLFALCERKVDPATIVSWLNGEL